MPHTDTVLKPNPKVIPEVGRGPSLELGLSRDLGTGLRLGLDLGSITGMGVSLDLRMGPGPPPGEGRRDRLVYLVYLGCLGWGGRCRGCCWPPASCCRATMWLGSRGPRHWCVW
ncbi:hypothetical protein GCM10023194_01750 [Planotetraspora phitsanulokensis]|uniref:Uncharacterized protein n=1 Tax=Planotetraspora phitsanulokensis TaxID=575192 RepID=A0A8J3U7V7_9ACTN|nr:hypothetical protein Pph01_52110 [Planotetraspora phitsanulokensis]